MEKILNVFDRCINNATTTIRTMWRNANNASHIRRLNRELSVRERLTDMMIGMITCFVFIVFCCIGFYTVDTLIDKIMSLVMAVAFLATMAWLYNYRIAIANSRNARIQFEERTRQTFQAIERNICRIIRRIFLFVVTVLIMAIAIQRIPGIEEQVPMVAEAADWVVDTFNNLMPKVVDFFKNLFSRFSNSLPR